MQDDLNTYSSSSTSFLRQADTLLAVSKASVQEGRGWELPPTERTALATRAEGGSVWLGKPGWRGAGAPGRYLLPTRSECLSTKPSGGLPCWG